MFIDCSVLRLPCDIFRFFGWISLSPFLPPCISNGPPPFFPPPFLSLPWNRLALPTEVGHQSPRSAFSPSALARSFTTRSLARLSSSLSGFLCPLSERTRYVNLFAPPRLGSILTASFFPKRRIFSLTFESSNFSDPPLASS